MPKPIKRSTISKGIRRTLRNVGAEPIDGGPLDKGIETFAKSASTAVAEGASLLSRARKGATQLAEKARSEIHAATKPGK